MSGAVDLFQGFSEHTLDTGEAQIFVRTGGSGPPLLLLHGCTQTHMAWHRIAPVLAQSFSIVVPDNRGYGRSSCPASTPDHETYSKRAMARDMCAVMRQLGYSSFGVVGHCRGAAIAHRLALDAPELIEKLVLVDMLPTLDVWAQINERSRLLALGWSFLAQPSPLPEALIARNPDDWAMMRLRRLSRDNSVLSFHETALADYRAQFSEPKRVHAICEDFRAGATCDVADDSADRKAGTRIRCPALVIWASHGALTEVGNPLAFWGPWCTEATGLEVSSGHWIAEEAPDALLAAMIPFLTAVPGVSDEQPA